VVFPTPPFIDSTATVGTREPYVSTVNS